MNILIDTIRAAGFRGIKNLEVSLPRITKKRYTARFRL